MARHKGFLSSVAQSHREAEQRRLAQMRYQNQAARTAAIAQKNYLEYQKMQMAAQANYQRAVASQQKAQQEAYEKALKEHQKEQQRLYLDSRMAEVAGKNEEIKNSVDRLNNLLNDTLSVDDYLDFNKLKEVPQIPPFQPGLLGVQPAPPSIQAYLPPELTSLQRLKPGAKAKYDQDVAMAHQRYQADYMAYQTRESQRNAALQQEWYNYQRKVAEIQQRVANQNIEVENFRRDFEQGQPEAIINYFTLVLEASSYPDTFPQHAKLGYIPESKQLLVDFDLPPFEIIPIISSYKYTKTTDQISEVAATPSQRKTLYASIVAQIAIRTLHELYEADRSRLLDIIVFNGYVQSLDPGTGHPLRTCLVTVRATREKFLQLDLSRVEPVRCLSTLNGALSKSPDELTSVRPVMEFNMIDARFIDETDILSEIDSRKNLMLLSPIEFESLVSNLFHKMGLETRLTRASRDNGVDCVAFDSRPIFGGKVIIQAKRYKNKVGVAAVRELFGTTHNEQASKGILITTSDYSQPAYEFASNKPLELLNGSNLLYLLKEYAGIEAKIVMPDDWQDTYSFEGE